MSETMTNEIADYFRQKALNKKTSTKPPYKKPDSIKQLEQDYFVWHYREKLAIIPEHARFVTKFSDNSTNALTTAIKAWFDCHGGQMARINTTGIYDVKMKRYRTSGSTKGVADLVGVMKGRAVSVEVKFGRDVQSEKQEKYQNAVERAGGIYIIARNFDGFLKDIEKFFP